MKKHQTNLETLINRKYIAPKINTESVRLEHSFAAGSATVTPVNSASQVREEWETGTDVVGNQMW